MSSGWIIFIIYIAGVFITSIILGIINLGDDNMERGFIALMWPFPATMVVVLGIIDIIGLPSKIGSFIAKMIENHKNPYSKAEKCAKCPNYQTCDNSVTVIPSNEKEINYG